MAGAALQLDLAGLQVWAQHAAEDLTRLSYQEPLRICAVLLAADAKENFAGGHSPDGTPWAPLAHPSQKRGGPSARPLRDKGFLMASVSGQGGQGHVEELTDLSLVWGTNLEYAAVMQFGHTFERPARTAASGKVFVFEDSTGQTVFTRTVKAHSQTVPARPFIGINDALAEKVEAVFGEFVEKKLGG